MSGGEGGQAPAAPQERVQETAEEETARIAELVRENERRHREVAERLAGEAQRRAAELDATINSIGEGIMIFDRAGELVRINARAMEILGVPPTYPGSPVKEGWEALRPETPEGVPIPAERIPIRQALQGETARLEVVVFHPRPDRAVWATGSAAPIRMPDGQISGAVVVFADITPVHELQEEREDLLRAVSHDLRNPLTAVQGQAQVLLRALEQAGLTGRERAAVEAILTGARRMNAMIQDLVDSARLEAGQLKLNPRPVDLPAFVLDLKGRLAEAMDTGRIYLETPPGIPPVRADPDRLERILTNLFSNALKYSSPGSQVRVTLRRENPEVITAVSDCGPGIPPEELPHLFERYRRARAQPQRQGGLGLGLYITRKLVEAHGGRIWAESQVGVGSTFSFSLPLAA